VQENLVLSWKFAELRDSPYKRNWTVTGQAAILLKHESQLAFSGLFLIRNFGPCRG